MRIADGIIYKRVGEELVLLDFDRETYYGLDEVGARIWQLLGDEVSVGEIIDRLEDEYEIDRGTLEADVRRLLGELETRGLIVR